MGKCVADITMSLDGFVTGPDPDLEHGLGRGGEPLHRWAVESEDPVDTEVLRQATEATGAVVMGRRLFDIIDGPLGWNDEMGYGAGLVGTPPFFVVTHRPPDRSASGSGSPSSPTAPAAAVERHGPPPVRRTSSSWAEATSCASASTNGWWRCSASTWRPWCSARGRPCSPAAERCEMVQREVRVSPYATHLTYDLPAPEAA